MVTAHHREHSQHDAQLQCDQLEPKGNPVKHVTSFPLGTQRGRQKDGRARDQYDHYYLYGQMLLPFGGPS
jgi:hypothetical protein